MENVNEMIENSVAGEDDFIVKNKTKKNEIAKKTVQADNLGKMIDDGSQEKMQERSLDLLKHVTDRKKDVVSEILQKVNGVTSMKTNDFVDSDKYRDKKKTPTDILPSKEFLERNSLLTELFRIKHIRAIYNFFVSFLIVLFLNTTIHDIVTTGTPNCGFATIARAFGKFPTVIYIWMLMKGSTLGVYFAFRVWSHRRLELPPKSLQGKIWDYGWIAAVIFYDVTFFLLPTRMLVNEKLPMASSNIVLMEQIRMLMKTHAFIRSSAPRFLSYKPHTDKQMPEPPMLSKFLYFMFAPTLIYRDSYPRTTAIQWRVVITNFVEVILTVFFLAYIYERFLIPAFQHYGVQRPKLASLVINIFATIVPAVLFHLCAFYCLLHCWMNGFAELMRFGDRMFYKDWWNSTSFNSYFRTWNVVVHDWLYTYIYKDMYEILTQQNKAVSSIAVFAISAIVHEYILSFTFGFFYPVMMILFTGPGVLLFFVAKKMNNLLLWLSLNLGDSIIISLYCTECFARLNCPSYSDDLLDLFLPRTWLCLRNSGG